MTSFCQLPLTTIERENDILILDKDKVYICTVDRPISPQPRRVQAMLVKKLLTLGAQRRKDTSP